MKNTVCIHSPSQLDVLTTTITIAANDLTNATFGMSKCFGYQYVRGLIQFTENVFYKDT